MAKLKNWFRDFCRDEAGATMVEYSIMVALIAVVAAATVTNIGTQVNTAFGQVYTALGGG